MQNIDLDFNNTDYSADISINESYFEAELLVSKMNCLLFLNNAIDHIFSPCLKFHK